MRPKAVPVAATYPPGYNAAAMSQSSSLRDTEVSLEHTSGKVEPSGRTRPWQLRLVFAIAVSGLFMLALRYDVVLMSWRYHAFPEGTRGTIKQIFTSLRDFGQMVPIAVGVLIVACTDRRRKRIIAAILLAQLLAAIVCNTTKLTVVRQRPFVAVQAAAAHAPKPLPKEQANTYGLSVLTMSDTWHGFARGNRDFGTQSFPSGHSAAAFAFAGVLVVCYPRLAVLLWCLAAGCSISRYIDAVHWASDCLAGATIGYVAAWLTTRWLQLPR